MRKITNIHEWKKSEFSAIFCFFFLLILILTGCATKAARLNDQGIELAMEGEYPEALRKFIEAAREDSTIPDIQLNIARTYLILKQPEKALEPAQNATKLLPENDLQSQLMLAQILFFLKKKDQVEKIMKKLMDAYPQNHLLAMAMGDLAMTSQAWDQAALYYEKAAKISEDDNAYTQLGRAHLFQAVEKAHPDKTIPITETGNTRAMMARIGNLISTGGMDLNPAKANFRKAVYINFKNVHARIMLGLIAFHTGAYEEADIEFTEALKLSPDNALIYMALGMNSQRRKQFARAEEYLAKASEMMPGQPEPKVLQIFLKIEKKEYENAVQQAMELMAQTPQIKEELFKTFATDLHFHVPWLIATLANHDQKKANFCAEALSFISQKPVTLDISYWDSWWQKEKEQSEKRLRQAMEQQMPVNDGKTNIEGKK